MILTLYTATPWEVRKERLKEMDAMVHAVTFHDELRDFHLILADGYDRFEVSDEKCLDHLLAAKRAGIVGRNNRATTMIRIGELAERLRRLAVAREAYEEFLREFQRDNRTFTIEGRLKRMGGAP
jgi:hypothetical protein